MLMMMRMHVSSGRQTAIDTPCRLCSHHVKSTIIVLRMMRGK
jgi:hypothetical protein